MMEENTRNEMSTTKKEQDVTTALTMLKNLFDVDGNNQDLYNVLRVLPVLLRLQSQKAQYYGRSYCRHGQYSIFFNMERKWDRISNMVEASLQPGAKKELLNPQNGTATENFLDTIMDLASYGLLWAGFLLENHPNLIDDFIRKNELNS